MFAGRAVPYFAGPAQHVPDSPQLYLLARIQLRDGRRISRPIIR